MLLISEKRGTKLKLVCYDFFFFFSIGKKQASLIKAGKANPKSTRSKQGKANPKSTGKTSLKLFCCEFYDLIILLLYDFLAYVFIIHIFSNLFHILFFFLAHVRFMLRYTLKAMSCLLFLMHLV